MRRIAAAAELHHAGREVRTGAARAERVTRSDAASPRGIESTREKDERPDSAIPARSWGGRRPGAGFLWLRPRPLPGRPIPGRPSRGPAFGLHREAAPPMEPRASAGPRETGGKQGVRREGCNVRDPGGSRCASTRPQLWLRVYGVSNPRGSSARLCRVLDPRERPVRGFWVSSPGGEICLCLRGLGCS